MLTYLISSFIANVCTSLLLTKLKCQMRILPPPLFRLEEVSYFVLLLFLSLFLLSFIYLSTILFDVFVVFWFDLSALWSTYVCNGYRRWWINDCSHALSLLTKEKRKKKLVIGNDKMYLANLQGKIKKRLFFKLNYFFLL